ncbi:uncharacterized protein LOC110723833 [Chenopodium quinoa]|uniref:uncharacterized protein LOC110723833 n=1 Tax=Chenopodium quinoa TaxID=63459 RepID=UPI000B77E91D|nr:uncharacterized protein LOC110723833 [Chenopodium quinoa]
MADIEPPSFSLGLDLDFDFEPSRNPPPGKPPTHKNSGAIDPQEKGKQKVNELEDVEFELRVSDSEPESPENTPRHRFRRLRRGVPSSYKPISTPISDSIDDDDIEDFSDEEIAQTNDFVAPQHHSSCSSSKLPLSGCGILMRQQENAKHNRKGKQDSSCPSTSLGSSKGKNLFSDLTASPLRRFQLIDSESDPDNPSDVRTERKASGVGLPNSNKQNEYNIQAGFKLLDSESDSDNPSDAHNDRDARTVNFSKNNKSEEYNIQERFKLLDSESDSDDQSDGEHIDRESSGADFSKNNKQKSPAMEVRISLGKNVDLQPHISQQQDLWKDFCTGDKSSVRTPAFDEFFTEYFQSVKSTKPAPGSHKLCSSEQEISMNNANNIFQNQNSGSAVPPSHHYFYHNDLRIQRLVRSRLPYFIPLTATDAGSKSHNVSSIDYMSQFGQDGGKRQTSRQVTLEKSSKRGRKKSKNSGIEGTSLGSGDWINPKQTASTPKDAGRRRVHADGQSAGRWLVAENGRKVYINKNGQELTGQIAYRQYRKESGRSFKKTKKKGATKKK